MFIVPNNIRIPGFQGIQERYLIIHRINLGMGVYCFDFLCVKNTSLDVCSLQYT